MKVNSSCIISPVFSTNLRNTTVYARIPLHPTTLNSFRLRQIASLFASYRFKSFRLKWVNKVPMTTLGSVGVYYCDDPSIPLQSVNDSSAPAYYGTALEANAIESEDGVIVPINQPFVLCMDKLVNEQNSWFRINGSSGILSDICQGTIVLLAGSDVDTGNVLGFFEMDYEIEFSHPVTPQTIGSNGNFIGGVNIPWSSMAATSSYTVSGNTTDVSTFNFWSSRQGVYAMTCGTRDYTVETSNWEFPAFMGQSYIVRVQCWISSLSSTNTMFTFYSTYSAMLMGDVMSLKSGSIPSVSFNGIQAYQIAASDTKFNVESITLPPSRSCSVVDEVSSKSSTSVDKSQNSLLGSDRVANYWK